MFSLERWQSPFKTRTKSRHVLGLRRRCGAGSGYRRKFNMLIDVSEEYVFHMGKSFALNRTHGGDRGEAGGEQFIADRFSGQRRYRAEAHRERRGTRGRRRRICRASKPCSTSCRCSASRIAQALQARRDYDAVEFCEQHIPLLARVNARYRATGWASLGRQPERRGAREHNAAEHEVVCDVTDAGRRARAAADRFRSEPRGRSTPRTAGARTSSSRSSTANDPNWQIDSGWYIEDVVDPTFVQNEACWLGNWWVTLNGAPSGCCCGARKISPSRASRRNWARPISTTGVTT